MKRLGLTVLMVLLLTFSVLLGMSKKQGEPPGLVSGGNSEAIIQEIPVSQLQQPTSNLPGASVSGMTAGETGMIVNDAGTNNVDKAQEGYSYSEVYPSGEPPGGYISPAIDNVVSVTIIPLLVLVVGLFWKGFDKNRFTKLLLQLWGLIKDADNFFAYPDAAQKRLIEDNGLNAAKKIWVAEQAIKSIDPGDVTYLKKKTGSLGNAIELAINVFKFGGTVFGLGKKVISVFK